MDQQSYELITNDTPIKKNWTVLGGEETEDINDPATPKLGNSSESLKLGKFDNINGHIYQITIGSK